jgi:hypothetical protein
MHLQCRTAPAAVSTTTLPPSLILTVPGASPCDASTEDVRALVPLGMVMMYLPSLPGITRRALPSVPAGAVTVRTTDAGAASLAPHEKQNAPCGHLVPHAEQNTIVKGKKSDFLYIYKKTHFFDRRRNPLALFFQSLGSAVEPACADDDEDDAADDDEDGGG